MCPSVQVKFLHLSQEMHQCNSTHTHKHGQACGCMRAHRHTDTHTQACTHAPQAVVTSLSFLINNAPYSSTPGDAQTSQGQPFPGLTLSQSWGKSWLPIAQNSLGCVVIPREKDLSPRFGNAGTDHRDHLAQSIKASYRHRLFRNLGLERERSCVGFSGRSRCSKPTLTPQHKEVKGASINFQSKLHQARLWDDRSPQKPSGNPSGPLPVPLATLTTHPLRFPTCSARIGTSVKKQSRKQFMTFYS